MAQTIGCGGGGAKEAYAQRSKALGVDRSREPVGTCHSLNQVPMRTKQRHDRPTVCRHSVGTSNGARESLVTLCECEMVQVHRLYSYWGAQRQRIKLNIARDEPIARGGHEIEPHQALTS
ncbi:hypothetical protein [uncultured Aeromicrobium sp.]|uniref:hypothetical protein n=1 Tax=uncultured Aeromicrobium sp. TaxID=337820 RepID=UPI0025FB3A05|nr:hypothetical protein [uncultured Aeromicrobium sp.]